MRNRFRNAVVVALALLVLVPAVAAQQVSLTILHTNDTHGHLKPFSYPDAALEGTALQGLTTHRNIGGIARRSTLVKRIREEVKTRGGEAWVFDAGDYLDGTPFSTEYRGEADVAAMNALGYDFGTIGNHELNIPLQELRKRIAETRYQLVCANVMDRAGGKTLLTPYVIRTAGSLRVAIFGLLTREAATYQAGREGLDIANEIDTARSLIPEMRRKADVVVLISHAGQRTDERLGAEVPGLDVIVGGHSHSRLPAGNLIPHSEGLKAADVNGTVLVQAHQWGGELGRLDLLFVRDPSGAWHVERYSSRLVPVTAEIPDDPAVAAVVEKYWQPISARYGEVIGKADGEFSSRGNDLAEYYLVDDAVREATSAEFALGNLGGVRSPLLNGEITRGDLINLDPFTNTVVTFRATGREIAALLARYAPSVSGIRYRVDGRQLIEATIGGAPLDPERAYFGATNSYFAGVALKGMAVEDTGRLRRDVLIDYIRKRGTVRPTYDGRRAVLNRQSDRSERP